MVLGGEFVQVFIIHKCLTPKLKDKFWLRAALSLLRNASMQTSLRDLLLSRRALVARHFF